MPPAEHLSELALPNLDVRGLGRRLTLVGLAAGAAVALLLLTGSHIQQFARALGRGLAVKPGWGLLATALEAGSLAGYVAVLSVVASHTTGRIGTRESAQIALAGTAATRLLPTAGAGGAALTLWALRRAGLGTRDAARTLLAFFVVLYSVFLGSIAVCGGTLALGIADGQAPLLASAVPAVLAVLAILIALGLARRHAGDRWSRAGRGAQLLGQAVRDALSLVRTGDLRLGGAAAYWLLDAAALQTMLNAFGATSALPVIVLAYFIGQVANTIPIPGSATGGLVGALIAFGLPAAPALTAVLAYRAIAVWLPIPLGVAALAALRSTVAGWAREDAQPALS